MVWMQVLPVFLLVLVIGCTPEKDVSAVPFSSKDVPDYPAKYVAADSDPPAAGQTPGLQFELVDGTVITGRIDAARITIRTPSGIVLNVPVADLKDLSVGLNDRPGFVQRVESLVKALDSTKTRQDARRELIALGPAVAPIVSSHAASTVSARRLAVGQVLKAYENWPAEHPYAPESMARPLKPQSKGLASEEWPYKTNLLGTVTIREFRIASLQGRVIVRLDDVHRIRPAASTPRKFGPLVVDLRDKTRLKGVAISQSLCIQTHYRTMVVPFAEIQKATFAADGKSICVQCCNTDRIVGALEPGTTISLKTDKGRADLSAGKIAMMFYWPLTLKGHSDVVRSVAFSPDGKRLASGSRDNTIKLWDTATGKELLTLKGHSEYAYVWSVAFSPDGKRLASGSIDRTIKIWDTATGKELLALKGHSSQVNSVAFSPDGKRLASGSDDEIIMLWDTVTGKELRMLLAPDDVSSVAFSPDGKRLAAGGDNGIIKLWDTVTGKELLTLKGDSESVNSVAFSPDGKRLASAGSCDGIIKLWDTVTGKKLLTLKGASLSVAFSPDGRRLASGSDDDTIRVWDTVTGKELLMLKGHSDKVWSVAFSSDGKRLASGSADKTINIWDALDWTKFPK